VACDGRRGGVGVNADPSEEHEENAGAYCRAIEAHLCRKNDGHLIRISGPAFDLVRSWADQGIPLRVATSGIDRTFERYYAKGPRRRPVHITFCEADVLEAFDAWRRATGVVTAVTAPSDLRPSSSLPAHVDRLVARLTTRRASAGVNSPLDHALDAFVRELDALRPQAVHARGDARAAIVSRLASLDDELQTIARTHASDAVRADAARDARADLEPFRERMSPDAYAAAVQAATDHHLREAANLPHARYSEE